MGDYKTVVRHWSIRHNLLHPSTTLLPFDGDPSCLGGEHYELPDKQTKAQKKFKSLLLERYSVNNEFWLDTVSGPNMSSQETIPAHETLSTNTKPSVFKL